MKDRFDLVSIGLAAGTIAASLTQLVFALFVAPVYARMFAEFGGALPALTVLELDRSIHFAVFAVSIALTAASFAFRGKYFRRGVLAILATVTIAMLPLFWFAMYYPLWVTSVLIQ